MQHITIGRVTLGLLAVALVCLGLAPVAAARGGNSANASFARRAGGKPATFRRLVVCEPAAVR
jgi:hypothetical protein